MANLHMNTEAMRSIAQRIGNTDNQLQSMMRGLNHVSQNINQHWTGGGSAQYQQQWNDWYQRFVTLTNELNELSSRIHREVSEWEQTAAQF